MTTRCVLALKVNVASSKKFVLNFESKIIEIVKYLFCYFQITLQCFSVNLLFQIVIFEENNNVALKNTMLVHCVFNNRGRFLL